MSGQPVSVLLSPSLLVTVQEQGVPPHGSGPVPLIVIEVPRYLLDPLVERALIPFATPDHVHSWVTIQPSGAFEFAAFVTVSLPEPVMLPVISNRDIVGVSEDGECRAMLPPHLGGLQRVDRLMVGNHADFDADDATSFFSAKEQHGGFVIGFGTSGRRSDGMYLNDRWLAQKQFFDAGNFPGYVELTRRFSASGS